MANTQTADNAKQGWPVAAMVALGSLLIAALVFVWVLHQQRLILQDVQSAAQQSQTQQQQMQQQFVALTQDLQKARNKEVGFMVKQQHYADLMGLLSEVYVNTERQDSTALEETIHRVNKAYFGLEPFLTNDMRDWMTQQIKGISGLSNKLAEPNQEYEENLLATKTTLRQLIDETHEKLFPALFITERNANGEEQAK